MQIAKLSQNLTIVQKGCFAFLKLHLSFAVYLCFYGDA